MNYDILFWSIVIILIIIFLIWKKNKSNEYIKEYMRNPILIVESKKIEKYRILRKMVNIIAIILFVFSLWLKIFQHKDMNSLIMLIVSLVLTHYNNRVNDSSWMIHEKGIIEDDGVKFIPWEDIESYRWKSNTSFKRTYDLLVIDRKIEKNMVTTDVGLRVDKDMVEEVDRLFKKYVV